MTTLESELARLEAQVGEAQKSAKALAAALVKIKAGVLNGAITDIEKGLATIAQRGQEASDAVAALPDAWTFDARAYLANGFVEELRAAADAVGLKLIEKDDRLYSFPLLLRIDPREATIRVGQKIERRIRPKELVQHLTALQKRPQRLKEQQFLNRLYRIYQTTVGAEWRKADHRPGPAISLYEIHNLLTLMLSPSEYPIEEFGRDLLLLARKPDLRTGDGAAFEFPASTLSKGTMKRILVYDESGGERVYIAIRFVKGS